MFLFYRYRDMKLNPVPFLTFGRITNARKLKNHYINLTTVVTTERAKAGSAKITTKARQRVYSPVITSPLSTIEMIVSQPRIDPSLDQTKSVQTLIYVLRL